MREGGRGGRGDGEGKERREGEVAQENKFKTHSAAKTQRTQNENAQQQTNNYTITTLDTGRGLTIHSNASMSSVIRLILMQIEWVKVS